MFLYTINYHVKEDSQVVKKAVYIAIGIWLAGTKEVMVMYVVRNEGSTGWESSMTEVQMRAMFGEMERPIRSNGVSWPLETECLLDDVVRSQRWPLHRNSVGLP